MFKRSRIVALIPAVLLAVTGLQVVAAPTAAEAASTCKGDACNDKDPKKYGCDKDAKTIDEFTGYAREELRYSKKCNSVWTRYTSSKNYNTEWAQVQSRRLGDKKQIKIYGVQLQKGSGWTHMVGFTGHWVRACESNDWFTGVPDECTGDN